jgi:hypothetical protein
MGNITLEQIESLARGIVSVHQKILDYYKDPKNEAAFQAWYLREYGHPAPHGA